MAVTFDSLLGRNVDVYIIDGIEAGYIDVRLDRRSVPDGIYVYEVRDTSSDGGWYIGNVEDFVLVNHAGTIFSCKPLPMLHPEYNVYIDLSEEKEPWRLLPEQKILKEILFPDGI